MKFIIGQKIGMTRQFREDGTAVPVTVVRAEPCVITQVKTKEKDGYQAVQVGSPLKKKQNKPEKGHTKELVSLGYLKEFRVDDVKPYSRGQTLDVAQFQKGELVHIQGVSRGKGFQGVVKRHGFKGAPASHGQKDQLRMPGSIGATGPQRVLKGRRMAGRMGGEQVAVKNLEVVEVDKSQNLILIKGSVPGSRRSLLLIQGV